MSSALLAFALAVAAAPVLALQAGPGDDCEYQMNTCVDAGSSGFEATGVEVDAPSGGGSGSVPGPGRPRPVAAGVVVQTRYVVMCAVGAGGADAHFCNMQWEPCPEGQVPFGEDRRTVDTRDPAAVQAAVPWQRQPGSVCAGAGGPVDPTAAVVAQVQRDFERVVVLRAGARVSPSPRTLVAIPTRFVVDAPGSYELPVVVLGQPVVITATAVSYRWVFGDGAVRTVPAGAPAAAGPAAAGPAAGNGTPLPGRVEHVYVRSGARSVRVDVVWSGTFTIGGDPTVHVVDGTVTTVGLPVALTVLQAGTELIDGNR